MSSSYSLINYFDVLGNAKDGWEVNNQCVECDDIHISPDATDKEICDLLKNLGMLNTSDMRRLEVYDWGDTIEIRERKGHKPLFGLIPN